MDFSQSVIDQDRGTKAQIEVPVYMGVKDFCKKFPFIKETTLRWQIHTKAALGISDVFIKPFGQRMVLVDVQRYFQLMRELGR
jgi:hypothetical protein